MLRMSIKSNAPMRFIVTCETLGHKVFVVLLLGEGPFLPLPSRFIGDLRDGAKQIVNNPSFAGFDLGLHSESGADDLIFASNADG